MQMPSPVPSDVSAVARRAWWLVLLVGIAFVIFGLVILFDVVVGVAAMVALLAAWLIVDGIADIVTAGRGGRSRVPGILLGLLAIAGGVLVAVYPGLGVATIVLIFAIVFLVVGVARIVAVIRFDFDGEGWVLALGILQVIAGIVAIVWPGPTVYVLAIVLGAYAVAGGAVDIAIALRLRKLGGPPAVA